MINNIQENRQKKTTGIPEFAAALGVIVPVPAVDLLAVNVTALNVCPLTAPDNVALLVPVVILLPYVIV